MAWFIAKPMVKIGKREWQNLFLEVIFWDALAQ